MIREGPDITWVTDEMSNVYIQLHIKGLYVLHKTILALQCDLFHCMTRM